jgi:hypothetical protein
MALDGWTMDGRWIGKNFEGRGSDLNETHSLNSPCVMATSLWKATKR